MLKRALLSIFTLLFITGCSVYMAATQPEKKDVSVLNKGTPRMHVIAEYGVPLHTEEKAGKKVDIFVFTQGYSTGARTGRALFHGAADVLTLGLWEVVGTPFEAVVDGTEIKVKISYDEADRVDHIEVIEGMTKLEDVDSIAGAEKGKRKSPESTEPSPFDLE